MNHMNILNLLSGPSDRLNHVYGPGQVAFPGVVNAGKTKYENKYYINDAAFPHAEKQAK